MKSLLVPNCDGIEFTFIPPLPHPAISIPTRSLVHSLSARHHPLRHPMLLRLPLHIEATLIIDELFLFRSIFFWAVPCSERTKSFVCNTSLNVTMCVYVIARVVGVQVDFFFFNFDILGVDRWQKCSNSRSSPIG